MKKSHTKKSSFAWDLSKVPPFVVWNRIKSLRKSRNLSMLDVAAGAKVSIPTICYLESGFDVQTKHVTKKKIARYFDVEIEQIFPVTMVGRITQNEYVEKKLAEDRKSAGNPSSEA